jgi:hypothetical protein
LRWIELKKGRSDMQEEIFKRIERLEDKMEQRFDRIEDRIDSKILELNRDISSFKRFTFGIILAVTGAIEAIKTKLGI